MAVLEEIMVEGGDTRFEGKWGGAEISVEVEFRDVEAAGSSEVDGAVVG